MSLSILAASLVLACQPAEVIDGATLRCEGRTVRLVGVGSPAKGDGADVNALQLMIGGQPTICRAEAEAPAGEVVARCWTVGKDLGCAMVQAGLAQPRARPEAPCP